MTAEHSWRIIVRTAHQLWAGVQTAPPTFQTILAALRTNDNNLHESIELVQYIMANTPAAAGMVVCTSKMFTAEVAGTVVGTLEIRRVEVFEGNLRVSP